MKKRKAMQDLYKELSDYFDPIKVRKILKNWEEKHIGEMSGEVMTDKKMLKVARDPGFFKNMDIIAMKDKFGQAIPYEEEEFERNNCEITRLTCWVIK